MPLRLQFVMHTLLMENINMLDYIRGILSDTSPTKVTVEVAGLGYALFIPVSSFGKLPQIGKEVLFYVTPVIREDSHRLFGFLTRKERNFFETLNEISGIGPKLSLSILGHMEIVDLYHAIIGQQVNSIVKIPGIGKKTAERMIIELRDKIKLEYETISLPRAEKENQQVLTDAISALINLGYTLKEAQTTVKNAYDALDDKTNLPALISSALKMKK